MRLVMLSDTHFGDPRCGLVERNNHGYFTTRLYSAFRDIAGAKNSYLILVGDILDFAVTNYQEAYQAAKAFFLQVQRDDIADEIIYIPGNHDFDIWHTVEYQVNVLHRLEQGSVPRSFRMSVAGVLDDRTSTTRHDLVLSGVTRQQGPGPTYAGLFLDRLTVPEGRESRFNFVYPNLYILTNDGTVLLTHGHYFDFYWTIGSVYGPPVLGRGHLGIDGDINLKALVGMNFPLNLLASAGVGQAKPLTDVLYTIKTDVCAGQFGYLKQCLRRLQRTLDRELFPFSPFNPLEWVSDLALSGARRFLLRLLGQIDHPRCNARYVPSLAVRRRLNAYFRASASELTELSLEGTIQAPVPARPSHLVFGHTHRPIAWLAGEPLNVGHHWPLVLHNTGGWLTPQETHSQETGGAEVFLYESNNGFSSWHIPCPPDAH